MFKTIVLNVFLKLCLTHISLSQEAFNQRDETVYIQNFGTLTRDSYSAPIPNNLRSSCRDRGLAQTNLPTQRITRSMTSSELQSTCGENSICTVPAGFTLTINSNLNLAALIISGTLEWNDDI